MNHHGPREVVSSLRTTVLQIETLGELEVELDGSALVGSFEGVLDSDVDFWTVEGTVARVELPFAWLEAVEDRLKLL